MSAKPRVLILDDEAILAMELEMLVSEAGYVPLGPVGTVDKALALIDEAAPDLAVLDVNLATGDSSAVADRLAELGIPSAFLTGYPADNTPGAHRDRPVLGKPFRDKDLFATLEALAS